MKKILSIGIAGALAGVIAVQAQTNVASQNAVGYIKHDIERGDFKLIQTPFFDIDGSDVTVDEVFGDQLPIGSSVFIWDADAQSYKSESLLIVGWTPGTNVFIPGQGFFVSVPSTAPETQYTAYVMGEVPDSSTLPTATVSIANGFTMTGVPYPVDTIWTSTTLAASAPVGSSAFLWDSVSQSYKSESKLIVGWVPGTNVIKAGDAFFFRTASATNWTETKPYSYP